MDIVCTCGKDDGIHEWNCEIERNRIDPDLARFIAQVQKDGYYRQGATCSHWGKVYQATGCATWDRYDLLADGEDYPLMTIHARDDKTAVQAFGQIFDMDALDGPEIVRVVTTVTRVYPENEPESGRCA